MRLHVHDNPALTVSLALTAGMLGQALARHLGLPGIVLLLPIGVLLGPDVAGVVEPASLGRGLSALVGVAAAVILFEGGLSLEWRRLKLAGRTIWQLITVGALVSLATGMLVALAVLDWDWQRALLFGTLVVVTGPTVVAPLVRRVRVQKHLATVLEAEGVFIDAVGAITAAVALEVVLRPSGEQWAMAAPTVVGRLLFGVVAGAVLGLLTAGLLRRRHVVPEGLENVLTLSLAVLSFELPNAMLHESGIAAVITAGFVVGNVRTHVRRELAEFKEQLTTLLIGMLFVLLAADVRVSDLVKLGAHGVAAAVGCFVLVRPLSVGAATIGTGMPWRERLFLSLIGPRGIVAAAVASVFSYQLDEAGIEGGVELRAMVFLVIAVTVFWSALAGPLAARVLRLRRKQDQGWVIVGGNGLARLVARCLREAGEECLMVDLDPDKIQRIESEGLRVIQGNALDPSTLLRAEIDTRRGALALTANEDVNYLFTQKARREVRTIRYAVTLTSWSRGVTPDMVDDLGAEVLFGAVTDVTQWSRRIDAGDARLERWRRDPGARRRDPVAPGAEDNPAYLPLIQRDRERTEIVTLSTTPGRDAEVLVVVNTAALEQAHASLRERGWTFQGEAPWPVPEARPR